MLHNLVWIIKCAEYPGVMDFPQDPALSWDSKGGLLKVTLHGLKLLYNQLLGLNQVMGPEQAGPQIAEHGQRIGEFLVLGDFPQYFFYHMILDGPDIQIPV